MKPSVALVAVLLLTSCASEPQPEALTQERACTEAEQVTDTYRDALGRATTPEDAKAVIDGAISGLRGIETAPPLATRIEALATALSDLLKGVNAGTPPAQLQPQAAEVGSATTSLGQACGRSGQ